MTLTIHRWSEIFENADTRKRERLKFYHAPSGNDSRGYITLVSRFPQGEALLAFGVFQALCQLSATLGRSVRGAFKNTDGTPMDLQQISCLLRVQECHLSAALEILTDKRIGWLKWEVSADNLPVTCQSPPDFVQGQGQGQGQEKESVKAHAQDAERIVSQYPRQEKRNDALRIVAAHLRDGEDRAKMFAGTKACAAVIRSLPSGASNRYVPSAAAFFEGKRWADDPETMRREPDKPGAKNPSHSNGYNEEISLD